MLFDSYLSEKERWDHALKAVHEVNSRLDKLEDEMQSVQAVMGATQKIITAIFDAGQQALKPKASVVVGAGEQ